MNWSKAKTIMILFLLCTNIFLLSILIGTAYKQQRVSPEIIDSAVTLLSSRGIDIDKRIIPSAIGDEKLFTVENIIADYESFARTVRGYNNDAAEITFNGDIFDIKFINGIETDPKLKSPADKARAYLSSLGIDTKKSSVVVDNNSDDIFTVCFTKTIAGKPFFDCSVLVELKGTKIISVRGRWFNKLDTVSTSNPALESVPGLLVEFSISSPELSGSKITGLNLGYAINEENVFHKQATIIPVYEITTDSENKYYIDARR